MDTPGMTSTGNCKEMEVEPFINILTDQLVSLNDRLYEILRELTNTMDVTTGCEPCNKEGSDRAEPSCSVDRVSLQVEFLNLRLAELKQQVMRVKTIL